MHSSLASLSRMAAACLLLAMSMAALAQAQTSMPARITAIIGMPGSTPRFANVTVEDGQTLSGCIPSIAGGCERSRRIVLTPPQRSELARRWREVAAMPRCEPTAFAPGDPAYTIEVGTVTYQGHLPSAASEVATNTTGPCQADARFAWWLAQRM